MGMKNGLKLVKAYQNNEKLRLSFNELARKTFGLDFEDWYQNGFWGEAYIPYSISDNGKIVANVSVNRMDFSVNGERKQFIQLGTVMTEEAYRNRGFIRRLLEEIEADFREKSDGCYLFANDSVLAFYPKFGFHQAAEYRYRKTVQLGGERTIRQVTMKEKKDWEKLAKVFSDSRAASAFDMRKNTGLLMFYVTKFMQENVYYSEKQDAYVIAEMEEGELFLHQVLAEHEVKTDELIAEFGQEVKAVRLGFTPLEKEGYEEEEVHEDDTTLFVKGKVLETIMEEKMMFPTLSHA